jgi:hypothetical protein
MTRKRSTIGQTGASLRILQGDPLQEVGLHQGQSEWLISGLLRLFVDKQDLVHERVIRVLVLPKPPTS